METTTRNPKTKMTEYEKKCENALKANSVARDLADKKSLSELWLEEHSIAFYACIGLTVVNFLLLFVHHFIRNVVDHYSGTGGTAIFISNIGILGIPVLVDDYWKHINKKSFRKTKLHDDYDGLMALLIITFLVIFLSALYKLVITKFAYCAIHLAVLVLAGYFLCTYDKL